ncbi:hypothetical protein HAX54_053452 [Datura stramonium]|uniref:Uncharacterized protein n=1 Tax=Datura stramonium TaxID=4076 RepID=A0ABS8WRP1_DATST|nr:hypothetical protein [Datura stramonium]
MASLPLSTKTQYPKKTGTILSHLLHTEQHQRFRTSVPMAPKAVDKKPAEKKPAEEKKAEKAPAKKKPKAGKKLPKESGVAGADKKKKRSKKSVETYRCNILVYIFFWCNNKDSTSYRDEKRCHSTKFTEIAYHFIQVNLFGKKTALLPSVEEFKPTCKTVKRKTPKLIN